MRHSYRSELDEVLELEAIRSISYPLIEPETPVTWSVNSDASIQILSKYSDDVWDFPSSLFMKSTRVSGRRVNFKLVKNASFRETLKKAILRYYYLGREGIGLPRGGTIISNTLNMRLFLNWLETNNVDSLEKVRDIHYCEYVEFLRSDRAGKIKGPISSGTMNLRLTAVKILYELLLESDTPIAEPWPDEDIRKIAKHSKAGGYVCNTDEIPPEILAQIWQGAELVLSRSKQFIKTEKALAEWKDDRVKRGLITAKHSKHFNYSSCGYDGSGSNFHRERTRMRTACQIIVMITTGMRMHEVLQIQTDSTFRRSDSNSDLYFIASHSDKTYEGYTEWIAPKEAIDAIKIAQAISQPMRDVISLRAKEARDSGNIRDADSHEAAAKFVFLAHDYKQERYKDMSGNALDMQLKKFADEFCPGWNLKSHQFRRTFAIYAARSILGDFRYLSKHFKHWSPDMTAGYVNNSDMDIELHEEVGRAIFEVKKDIVNEWVSGSKVSGGLKEGVQSLRDRSDPIRIFHSHQDMVNLIARETPIRSTGVAWCTHALTGCVGGSIGEETRCFDCANSIIDKAHQSRWENMYLHQLELKNVSDCGEGFKEKVDINLSRCEIVLSDLGADITQLKEKHSKL